MENIIENSQNQEEKLFAKNPLAKGEAKKGTLLFLIFMFLSFSGAAIGQLGAVASWISVDLGLSKAEMGVTQTCFWLGNLLGAMISRRLIERFSVRFVFVGSLGSMALGALCCSVPNFYPIVLGRAVTGFGFSTTIVLCSSLLVVRFPSQQSMLMSLLHAIVAGSVAITLFAGQWFGEMLGNWAAVFWVTGFSVCGAAFLAAMFDMGTLKNNSPKSQDGKGTKQNFGRKCSTRFKDAPLRNAMLIALGYLVLEQALTMFLQVWAIETLEATPTQGGSIAAALWVGLIIGRLFNAAVVTEGRALQMLSVCGVAFGLSSAMLMNCQTVGEAIPFVAMAGFWGGPLVPLAFAYASKETSLPQVTAMSTCQIAVCVGGLTGPFLVGWFADLFSLHVGILLASAIVAMSVFPALWLLGLRVYRELALSRESERRELQLEG